MKINHLFVCVLFISACQPSTKKNSDISNSKNSESNSNFIISDKNFNLKDTTVLFLWRENIKDSSGHAYSTLVVNEAYCKTIPEPIKAAIAFTATFIGNECWWENDAPNEDRTNLKCKILSVLDLGCQGSDTHLKFLNSWFASDKECLEKLNSIPTTPYTATIQDTFDEINVTVKGNIINVSFKARGMNIREVREWEWKQTDSYAFSNNSLRVLKSNKTNLR